MCASCPGLQNCRVLLLTRRALLLLLPLFLLLLLLLQTITSDMRGFIIADDISSVLVIEAAKEGDFELWHT